VEAPLNDLQVRIAEGPAFPRSEYERRVQTARAAMERSRIDLLVLFDPQSVCYFSGYSTVNLWDFAALVLGLDDDPSIILWDFELPRFEASGALGVARPYAAGEDPVTKLIGILGQGHRPGAWASDDWTPGVPPAIWRAVAEALAPAEHRDARPVLWATRLRKSRAEIRLLERSAAITDMGVDAAVEAVRVGVSDGEIAAAAAAAMLRARSGHFSIQPIIAVGPRAGVPHSEASGRRVEPGEAVFVELGAAIERYTAPVMRSVVAGEPGDELLALESLGTAIMEAQLAVMQPGASCAEIAKEANKIVSEAGPDVLFHGFLGYPVGISFPPSWLEELDFQIHETNPEPLDAGMVFHIPLSLRHRGRRGVGMSYTVVVEQEGARILNGTSAALIVKHEATRDRTTLTKGRSP
jgi:Xaa-Pro dipeptidase